MPRPRYGTIRSITTFVIFASSAIDGQEQVSVAHTIEVDRSAIPPRALGWVTEQVGAFERAYPNIEVRFSDAGMGLRPLTHIRDVPGLAKNVIGVMAPASDEIAYLASRETIVPLDSYMTVDGFDVSALPAGALSSATFDGRIWGIPWCLDAVWLVCNRTLFDAAGLGPPPRTWTEFMEYARVLTKDTDGDGQTDQFGFRAPEAGAGVIAMLLMSLDRQDDVDYLNNGRIELSSTTLPENVRFIQRLLDSGFVYFDPRYTFAGERSDTIKCGMQIMTNIGQRSNWAHESAKSVYADPDLEFAPLPTNGANASIVGERYYFCIRRSNAEAQQASWEFLKWFVRPSLPLDGYWFGYPINRQLTANTDFKQWAGTTCRNVEAAIQSMDWSRSPDFTFDLRTYGAAVGTFTDIFTKRVTIEDGIANLEIRLNEFRLAPSEPVREEAIFE